MRKSALALGLIGVGLGFIAGITAAVSTSDERTVADFHRLYHDKWWKRTVFTHWLGVQAMKCPLDMWVYQEIIYETRPDILIETGTCQGGSALFYAGLFDQLQHGKVFTVEIQDFRDKQPKHPRINYLMGSSSDEAIVRQIRQQIAAGDRVMVTLDSLHTKQHVSDELRLYAPLVSVGSYLVVEDTHLGGHPLNSVVEGSGFPAGDPGPWGAVEQFLAAHPEFTADRSREKFGLTFNPRGWLKRVR